MYEFPIFADVEPVTTQNFTCKLKPLKQTKQPQLTNTETQEMSSDFAFPI